MSAPSDRQPAPGAALPPLAPISRRIGEAAAAMTRLGERLETLAAPRIDGVADETLVRPPVELAQIGPDPADAISRIKPGRSRDLDRPDAMVDQLKVVTPQFFLRSTARLERYADPSWIETTTRPVRDFGFWDDIAAASRCAGERPDLAPETSSIRLAMLLAEREVVMIETRWNEVFGRPDPVE
ncbi:MAG: hypothetical protein H6705_07995 [Myxococcales bacterium]|nr:hypothetical protein [Myxococcales bacterium]